MDRVPPAATVQIITQYIALQLDEIEQAYVDYEQDSTTVRITVDGRVFDIEVKEI